ncbi:hypothetical protein [Burkholderia multivorans]|uniref:hypothetical protein n=1 Tax=Burkholderia multivorans TaxID=87883 RepID=UPI000A84A8F5|nr:hypothetical protein [Burkholderia multivorans]MBR8338456.1 hypothetical protein [Burkholderia multivorans]MBU9141518.1 hypothetical protein [Burkholderia multivorans]MBU9326330.1 hypothetical protein [Burkholderia multivorans]MBU9459220.1 hypothetical protein [Burkholderia multivorans]MBU9510914.1 hypothetical protein [Burkholderia multivorans]
MARRFGVSCDLHQGTAAGARTATPRAWLHPRGHAALTLKAANEAVSSLRARRAGANIRLGMMDRFPNKGVTDFWPMSWLTEPPSSPKERRKAPRHRRTLESHVQFRAERAEFESMLRRQERQRLARICCSSLVD